MDLLSLFWGENLEGGGVKELLIPINKYTVMKNPNKGTHYDHKDLRGNSIVNMDTRKLLTLPDNIKTMDDIEKFMNENGIRRFKAMDIDNPLLSTSYATKNWLWAKKKGGKISVKLV